MLIGGQAVTFWTRFLEERSNEIDSLAPIVSKDIDFEGSARTVRRATELLSMRMRLALAKDIRATARPVESRGAPRGGAALALAARRPAAPALQQAQA